jgi:hypothetical protein
VASQFITLDPTMVTESDSFVLKRPFYFIVVLWGEQFRRYFLDLCLPTLLSPGNLPTLAAIPRSKFLIFTCSDDIGEIKRAPIFALLEKYVEPILVEIPPCPTGTHGCVHMGFGHRRGLEMAYAATAYPFVLTPDSVFSDGTVRRLQQLASEGVELVLVPALRFSEEPLFDNLRKLGVSLDRNGAAAPITLESRQLAHAALNSMHSETLTYEWNAPYFFSHPSAVWWRVPGEDGIVVHSLSWAAPLLDFSVVRTHDTSTFDEWTFDGDYIYKNLGDIKKIHLVRDSDEMFIASWAPAADKPYPLTPRSALQRRFVGELTKKARFRNWFYSGIMDPFKQEIFFQCARWHAYDINDKWDSVEHLALTTLLSCVAPPRGRGRTDLSVTHPEMAVMMSSRQTYAITAAILRGSSIVSQIAHVATNTCGNYKTIVRRFGQIARRDPIAIRRVKWRARMIAHEILRRPFKEPEPVSPDAPSLRSGAHLQGR